MKLTKEETRRLLADIYYKACLDCGTDMKELADVLEYLAETFGKHGYTAWSKIKLDRQRFDKHVYVQDLSTLKQQYYNLLAKKIQQQIEASLNQNDFDGAFAIWKKEYCSALAAWKAAVYIPICNVNYGLPNEYHQAITRFQQLNKLILETSWTESYPFFCELAADGSIGEYERSFFAITAGQIQLYWMPDYKQSLDHFENALSIFESNPKALTGLGEYYIKLQEFEKARSYLLQAISIDPYNTDNYLRMGDSYKDENKLDAAEQWYTDALNTNFLETSTYSKLIALFGEADQPERDPSKIHTLVQKVEVLEPNSEFSNELYHTYRDAGNSFLAVDDFDTSRIYYQKAIELKPAYTGAMIDLGNMYSKAGNHAAGEEWFKKALAISENDFDAYWGLAWLYEQQKRLEEAEQAYMRCLLLRPSWTDSIYNSLGVMFYNDEQFEKARDYYEKAISHFSDEPVYHENLRNVYIKLNMKDELELVLTTMYERFPEKPEYAYQLGQFYDENQQPEKALHFYRKAIETDELTHTYFESLGLVYEKMGEIEEAERSFLKSYELHEDYLTCNRLGIFYYQQKDYEKAISYYQKAIGLNEKDAVLRGNIGLAYEYGGNAMEAEKAYLQAIHLNPSDAAAYNRLGLFYYNQQQYSKAATYYKIALEKQPDHPVYLKNLAYAYEWEKQWAETVPLYQALVQQSPEDHALKLRLGISLFKTARYREALDRFIEIREQYPNDVPFLEYLAKAYEQTGNNHKALEVYKEALRIAPDDEYLNGDTGLLYYNMGAYPENIHKALDHYQKAINAKPDVAVYYYYQALAHSNLLYGFEEAQQAYQKAISLDPGNDLYHNQYGVLLYNHALYEEAIKEYKKAIELNDSVAVYYNNLGIAYQVLDDVHNSNIAFEKARTLKEDTVDQ